MRWVAAVVVCAGCQLVFPRDESATSTDGAVDAPDLRELANIAFITTNPHTGNLGGLEGADAICMEAARTGQFSGTFVAWLSDTTTPAITRLAGSRGWVRPDGQPVADQPGDLTSKGPLSPISVSESNQDLLTPGTQLLAFTGADPAGGIAPDSCSDWTSTGSNAEIGDVGTAGGGFTAIGNQSCSMPARLYCFGLGKQFPVQPTRRPGDFVMFVSAGSFTPRGTGRADADTICDTEARAAHLDGTFLAALPLATEPALARFVDREYVRPDGVRIGHFLTDIVRKSFPNLTAAGTRLFGSPAWTGGMFSAAPGDEPSCTSWTSTSTLSLGTGGDPEFADERAIDGEGLACTDAHHVFCLQQ